MTRSQRHQLHDPRVASLVLCALRLGLCTEKCENKKDLPQRETAVSLNQSRQWRANNLAKSEDSIPELSIDSPYFDTLEASE